MGLDPGDGQVMMPADCGEKAPDALNDTSALLQRGLIELSPKRRTQFSLSVRRLMRFRTAEMGDRSPPWTHLSAW